MKMKVCIMKGIISGRHSCRKNCLLHELAGTFIPNLGLVKPGDLRKNHWTWHGTEDFLVR